MRRWCLLGAMVAAGCDASETAPPAPPDVPPSSCEPLELALPDGSCIRPGIAPEGCADGFAHDGEYGCEPILPPDRCPPGLMAIPGETRCRPVMPCGSGRWGDIPVDATTQYVDASYSEPMSDGSAERPWTNLNDAYEAVVAGGSIAVAAGSYVEDLIVLAKPVRIWGVCPERTEIVGRIIIVLGPDGSELHGLGLRGVGDPSAVSDAFDVLLDRVWMHDAEERGMEITGTQGLASATITGSLIENNVDIGILIAGASVDLDTSVVRGTLAHPDDGQGGYGLQAQECGLTHGCPQWSRSELTVERALLEDNRNIALYVIGSDASIDGTVVRGTLPRAADQAMGRGIEIEPSCDATFTCNPEQPSRVTVRGSLLEENHDEAVAVLGSQATIEDTVVRATKPRAADQGTGRALSVEIMCHAGLCDLMLPAQVEVRRALIEQNNDSGIFVMGSEALIEDTVVRDTMGRESDGLYGRGLIIQVACPLGGLCDPRATSTATVRRTLVDRSQEVGIYVMGATTVLEASVVRDTRAVADGTFGDGIAVMNEVALGSVTATLVRVDHSARAGVANFGAFVSIGSTLVRCSAFDLEGEPQRQPFSFEDRGNNRCGCPIADGPCIAVSPGLEPPTSIGD